MNAKAERFELRIDERLYEAIDQWRLTQSDTPSRSEAARRLIESGLAQDRTKNIQLTDGEKLLLMMFKDVYKHLKVDGEIDPDFVGEVIYGGHYWAPKWHLTGLFHGYVDQPDDVDFVVDVLDMWDFLERGYERLTQKEKERVAVEAEPFGKYVKFMGFDGNNEAELIGIARFFVDELNRFTRFKGRELNSHLPTRATYRRMLNVFEPFRANALGREFNANEIISILSSKKYPAGTGL